MLAKHHPEQPLDTSLTPPAAGADYQSTPDHLADQAARCRRLAHATHDGEVTRILSAMAVDYEKAAETLRER